MAATLPRPQGARSGISSPASNSLQNPKKLSLIGRPSTPSRLSSIGAGAGLISSSKSLQKSVSMAQLPKGSRSSLTPTSPLANGRRMSSMPKGNHSPTLPSQLRDDDHDAGRLTRKSTSNIKDSYNKKSDESGLLGILPSPPPSRSGSAEGSYTSVTAFDASDVSASVGRGVDMDDGGKEGKGNVVVSVRCRPDPQGDNGDSPWVVDGRGSRVVYRGGEGGEYCYDNVFSPNDDNSRVYDACAKRLVRRVMEGYHGTVFAYGMTGTGKTFSMQGTTSSPGVIPLAINDIFSFIRETPHREFLLRVSYLEIYNEKINDLLSASTNAKGGIEAPQEEIKLREDSKRGVYATPLKEEIVQSPTQLLRVIARGDMARRVAGTQFNARSSRSHAVVQVVVESRDRIPGGNPMGAKGQGGGVRVSTLSLIDLAGSERAAESKERRQEGSHINRSLLTLGTVIARLSDSKSKDKDKDQSHLPYRDSKLTRLLQPALSGGSLVSILCTISCGGLGTPQTATNETLNTLKFASRARNSIVSHAKKADEGPGTGLDAGSRVLLERYRMEIEKLRAQLEDVAKEKEIVETREEKEKEKDRHEEQMLEMQLARTALKERIEHLNRLILCSKSTGVNSARNSSMVHPGHLSTLSTRSSFNLNSLSRQLSSSNTSPVLSQHQSMTSESSGSYPPPTMEFNDEDESGGGEYGDGYAAVTTQLRALQTDVMDKNRYIATLEKRLLQARRTSHGRASLVPGALADGDSGGLVEEASLGNLVKDKDAEIANLRAQLDDKERMVSALRNAARKRDAAADSGSTAGSRTSVCSSCGLGSPSTTAGSRANSYIAPLPSSVDLGLGLTLSRIRTKSMDDGLNNTSGSRSSTISTISLRNSLKEIHRASMNSSPTITQTPLPFPPGMVPSSSRHSHPRLKPFILPWKLATSGNEGGARSGGRESNNNSPTPMNNPPQPPHQTPPTSTTSLSHHHYSHRRSKPPSQQEDLESNADMTEEDEEAAEAVLNGRFGDDGDAEGAADVDVHVARLSMQGGHQGHQGHHHQQQQQQQRMSPELERKGSNGSLMARRREGFLSGFRNGSGIGLPPEIGVEELGLGENVVLR